MKTFGIPIGVHGMLEIIVSVIQQTGNIEAIVNVDVGVDDGDFRVQERRSTCFVRCNRIHIRDSPALVVCLATGGARGSSGPWSSF